MNKILYIGNIAESSGYSYAIESGLKSLYYSGQKVAAHNLNLTNSPRQVDSVIQKLLNTDPKDSDCVIIHSLPEYFQKTNLRSIGRFDWEASNLLISNWKKKIQLMDEVWVTCKFMADALKDSGVTVPIRIVPHAVDPNRFEKSKILLEGEIGQLKTKNPGVFIYYTIGEAVTRKNYETMLTGWHLAFGKRDDVELVIKTSLNGVSSNDLHKLCLKLNDDVLGKLKLNKKFAKNPLFITSDYSEEQIDGLHQNCDCFISTSFGEGWCQPAVDALCFGKPVIVPAHTAFLDYVHIDKDENGLLLPCFKTPCYGVTGTLPSLYSGYNSWFQTNLDHYISTLKQSFKMREKMKLIGLRGKKLIDQYNYQIVGSMIQQYLSG